MSATMSPRQKILLIEDNDMFRWQLLHFFQDQGFAILEAEDGIEGITLAQSHQPDLILCDISMPRFNGYDVLKNLQRNQATAAIPLIFLTNWGESERDFAVKAGAKDCLSKACSLNQVLQRMLPHLK